MLTKHKTTNTESMCVNFLKDETRQPCNQLESLVLNWFIPPHFRTVDFRQRLQKPGFTNANFFPWQSSGEVLRFPEADPVKAVSAASVSNRVYAANIKAKRHRVRLKITSSGVDTLTLRYSLQFTHRLLFMTNHSLHGLISIW